MKIERNEKLNNLCEICKKFGAWYDYDVPLSDYTTFRIGGKAQLLVKANSAELISELVIASLCDKIRYTVLGRGSNVLVSDNGIDGIVIVIGNEFSEISIDGEMITAQAGASLSSVCKTALEHSLTGLEFAYGIPGTVGGGLVMNAGAYGGEMKDVVFSCSYLDEAMNVITADVSGLDLSYRHSIFSIEPYIVTEVTFQLKKGNHDEIENRMNELIARRKDKQPLEFASAGSTFKRPADNFASKLIEECGLKGYCHGDAEVSRKHSGFVINRGEASFDDVMNVVDTVKEQVFEKTGIMLECEMLILK